MLEGAFVDELALLQPTPGYMRLAKDRILHVWEQRRAEANERTTERPEGETRWHVPGREAIDRGPRLRSLLATENTPRTHEPFLNGLAVSPRGDIYLAATGCREVLKLDPNGRVSRVLKAEAPWAPTGLALHGEDLYVAEWTNAHNEQHDYRPRVRKVDRDGKVTTLGTSPE